jgi:hypothetical protein
VVGCYQAGGIGSSHEWVNGGFLGRRRIHRFERWFFGRGIGAACISFLFFDHPWGNKVVERLASILFFEFGDKGVTKVLG